MFKALFIGIAIVLVAIYQFTGITPIQVMVGLAQFASMALGLS